MAEEQQDNEVEIQDFILSRELAEVYLLMDHISACQNKEIPATLGNDPVFNDAGGRSWLEQVCEIAWPPEDTTRAQDARNAARLIRAKDVLNKAAAPATGGTIAFTLMMAGEARDPQGGSWWRRTLMWMADAIPSDIERAVGRPIFGSSGTGSGFSGGQPPSRASLASLAYPSLARRAWQYRLGLYFILGFLVLWLYLTCVLSWDVATGNSLLNRVTTLEARELTLLSAQTPPTAAMRAPATETSQTTATEAPSTNSVEASTNSAASSTNTEEAKLASESGATAGQYSDLPRTVEQRGIATENLLKWMQQSGWIRRFLINRMGGPREALKPERTATPAAGAQPQAGAAPAAGSEPQAAALPDQGAQADPRPAINKEWAAALLGILASNILPIFYGLLGAGAAVVRSVSQKMRESLLAPRDIWLAYVQLALGAVIGACIGLFVNSEGDAAATQSGLLGSVPLSASALCFVAGFGVEGVFQALESLIRRVFNLEAPRAPPTT